MYVTTSTIYQDEKGTILLAKMAKLHAAGSRKKYHL